MRTRKATRDGAVGAEAGGLWESAGKIEVERKGTVCAEGLEAQKNTETWGRWRSGMSRTVMYSQPDSARW